MNENSHKGEELKGKAKTVAGKATGDTGLEAEGKADQVQAEGKQAGDKVKDTAHGIKDSVKDSSDD